MPSDILPEVISSSQIPEGTAFLIAYCGKRHEGDDHLHNHPDLPEGVHGLVKIAMKG